jgi:DNA repair exonuclease SbcCD ATPase subunit
MTKIKLQEIAINNFKGIRFLKLNPVGKDSVIVGANGSGKTTVYKAYFWCLTGKTLEPNETVQTLDQDNEVIHKIETSVVMTLLIDDSYEVTLERKLVEDWRALGMPDETFKGTNQKCFYNEVPLSKDEFNAKLNAICNLEKWVLLSNINTFMSLKTEDRRKMLMDMAGEVDEQQLMSPYPAVMKAVNTEKKTIEELKIQTLSTKKRSNDELKTIPSQIDAQDRLKVNADFKAKNEERDKVCNEIADIDRQLEGTDEELEAAKKKREGIDSLRKQLDEKLKKWNDDHEKELKAAQRYLDTATEEYKEAERKKKEHAEEMVKKASLIKAYEEKFAEKKKEWMEVNKETYTEETLTFCPVCGHVFTEEEKRAKGNAAIEHFNKEKSEKLRALLDEATKYDAQIKALTGVYNEGLKIIGPQIDTALASKQTALDEATRHLNEIKAQSSAEDKDINNLRNRLFAEAQPQPQKEDTKADLKARKKELEAKRDELTKICAGEETNQRIEEEKERLNKRAKELAQIVADCDATLYQIMEYKKSKIGAIEGKINGMFQLARWKFFEKNITDDNFKEICKCLHNGIDYNSTNAADKINLGVDIVSTIGKAYGIEAPVWIDFRESVTNLLEVDNQEISLKVVDDSPLTLINN